MGSGAVGDVGLGEGMPVVGARWCEQEARWAKRQSLLSPHTTAAPHLWLNDSVTVCVCITCVRARLAKSGTQLKNKKETQASEQSGLSKLAASLKELDEDGLGAAVTAATAKRDAAAAAVAAAEAGLTAAERELAGGWAGLWVGGEGEAVGAGTWGPAWGGRGL